jgi:hypothetical protein
MPREAMPILDCLAQPIPALHDRALPIRALP